jgi:hypothetical protein
LHIGLIDGCWVKEGDLNDLEINLMMVSWMLTGLMADAFFVGQCIDIGVNEKVAAMKDW